MSHSENIPEPFPPEEENWARWKCHVCFITCDSTHGMPPDTRRCDKHGSGKCEECAEKYPSAFWCRYCAREGSRGDYRVPSAGMGRHVKPAFEPDLAAIRYGRFDHFPSLTLEMSCDGIHNV